MPCDASDLLVTAPKHSALQTQELCAELDLLNLEGREGQHSNGIGA